ncbi:UDP-N-acetylenolpyruvoylglucosamine reductase [Weissella oryzae SG25]|uniref:UDP-N-acetylenolpyruvoylglucosamine reductase n=2 Tax=Weissella TaxID=46255 RepID=A0A069CVE0_WEIOS|nr:UDP-N-acetylenolpyruvoylglucosamine reductase [Weissella oryzae SG25]
MMEKKTILEAFPTYKIKKDEQLAKHTNTRVGGPADYAFWPQSLAELSAVVDYARQMNLSITVLGNASNLIITDEGLRGLVIFLAELKQITVNEHEIRAEAGAMIIDLAQVAQEHALSGLEWAAGIPGSVGGAVYMNAGAYGGQIDGCLTTAEILTRDGQIQTLTNAELDFGYRHSSVQDTGAILLAATFTLRPAKSEQILAQMEDFNERRASRQPLEFPSCGSVFKRPVGHFAGKLIMDAGLQGYQIGGAQVSTKHAGFIINVGQASGADYVAVIKHVQAVVQAKFGVNLETEVRILGE